MARIKGKKLTGNRAAAYIRVSDESQVEGYSLEAQRAEITRWCQRRGYDLVKVYVEEGKSAHTDRIDRRPQLDEHRLQSIASLSQAFILTELDIGSQSLYQVFRSSSAWNHLITTAPGRGMYCLNLPSP